MDVVAMNILESTMLSICREMGITLMKTSYSTIFNEALDFTCALADAEGDMIAAADFCPAHIGGMSVIIKACVQEMASEHLEDGDVIVHNDPYRGGLHTPDHTFFMPFFVDGQLMGYAVSIGHVAEIGGMVPGSFASEATEIFHEGIRIPPVKIKRGGKDVDQVWKLLLANVRTPRHNYGDYRALISACEVGAGRMSVLIEKYGKNEFSQLVSDLIDYSENRMRAEISDIPDGKYSFEDFMEDDGLSDTAYRVAVDVFVQADELIVDFGRSDAQAPGAINATLGVSWSAAFNAILHLTDPSIPRNSGCFRPVRVLAAPGSIANVDYPAPEVGGNTETHLRLCYAVVGALSTRLPERTFATDAGTHCNFLFGGTHPVTEEYYVCYDFMLGGWGGRPFADGHDTCNCINGNCRTVPVEVYETRYPWLVENLSFVDDSGGPGQFRGGLGSTKTLVCCSDEITISHMGDRHKTAPWGLLGGEDGGKASLLIQRCGEGEWQNVCQISGKISPSKFGNVAIRRGDKVRITTCGGGGYGRVSERLVTSLEEDILEGYVSKGEALDRYGYIPNAGRRGTRNNGRKPDAPSRT